MKEIKTIFTGWDKKILWILDPIEYMRQGMQECPDIFMAKPAGFGEPLVFINHPQGIQQLLTNDRKTFFAGGELNSLLAPIVGNSSLLSLDGSRHRRERKLMMPPFHGDRMVYYGDLVHGIVDDLFKDFQAGDKFIAQDLMQGVSLQVILKVVFGLTEGQRYDRMATLIKKILNLFNQPVNVTFLFYEFLRKDLGKWSPWGNFLRVQKELDQLIEEEIRERRVEKNPDRVDMLSLLLQATDEQGEGLSNQELRDELMLILFAGHETTAIAMTWALYWSHYHPEIGAKIRTELAQLPHDADGMTICKQPYLNAVCNETLRIHPVAVLTFPRRATEDVEMMGYHIPKDAIVAGCIYTVHHREDLYSSHDEFMPERFLEKPYSPYEFLPFGGGVRRCIGEALASYEMRLVTAQILSKYQLELQDKKPLKARRRGVVLRPEGGVPMIYQGTVT
ncbi:MAG: cytochrome P450 [Cyanobacterium sp.]